MILLTELSTRETPSSLLSDSQGVWRQSFGGEPSVIDEQGVEWFWTGRQQVIDIRGASVGTTNYAETTSLVDCRAQPGSIFWDDANSRNYVHHTNNENDYAIGRSIYALLIVSAGYATGRFPGQRSYYPDFYFDPVIQSIGALQKRVDPLKFGLLSFESSQYQLDNAAGKFDAFTDREAFNSKVNFVLMEKAATGVAEKPVAYYSFDADSSVDDSGNGNDGVDTDITYEAGIARQAARFNGLTSRILLPSGVLVVDDTTSFSVSAWPNLDTLSPAENFARVWTFWEGSGSGEIYLRFNATSDEWQFFMVDSTSAARSISSGSGTATTDWAHLVATYDGSTKEMKLYLDAGTPITNTYDRATITPTVAYIGGRAALLNFDGLQDEVRLYKRTLSVAEVDILFRHPDGDAGFPTDDIDDGVRLFTGFTGGASFGDDSLSVALQEARRPFDQQVCPSVFDLVTFPSLDPKFENKRIPVAYGDIRRGIAVPIDSDGVETADAATITFKLADSSLHAIGSVTALYDDNGNSVTLGTISLANCTVQYAKGAGDRVDLGKFSWEGTGYVIPGDDDNGLDIMKDVLTEQGGTAFTVSTYDTTQWTAEQAAHPEPIGISVQSERGLIEEIIQPITVSLQGIVDVLGDGRLTFISRDTTAKVQRFIEQHDIIAGPSFSKDPDSVVSRIAVNYAPSFVDRTDVLTEVYEDQAAGVIARYGIDRTLPVSPVETVLTVAADALAVGAEVATTTADPETLVELTIPLDDTQTQLFDIVQADVGRPRSADYRVFEVLRIGLAFVSNELRLSFTLRELVDREPVFPEPIFTEDWAPILTEAGEPILTEG